MVLYDLAMETYGMFRCLYRIVYIEISGHTYIDWFVIVPSSTLTIS